TTPVSRTLPLYFEANQGQVDSQALYLARVPHGAAFLTAGGAVLSASGTAHYGGQSFPITLGERIQFPGGNPSPTITGEQLQTAVSNYFLGNDPSQWHTGVPNYGQVRYQGVYPGVDVVFRGDQGNVRYDFEVAAGANPGAITVSFPDATGVDLSPGGRLLLHTPL